MTDLLDEERPATAHNGSAPDNGDVPRSVAGYEADVEGPTPPVLHAGGTFAAFRNRDYSLFWSGALVSNVGSWMQMYALSIVVYSFRRSEADLGYINALSGIPVLFLALPAGALADRIDRRKLLIVSQFALGIQAAALAIMYATGHLSARTPVTSLIWVGVLGLIGGIMSALTFPAWQSMVPDIVPRENLLNAIALNAAQFQTARMIGPLAASGLVLLGAGMGDIFFINAGSFLFVIAALWIIRPAIRHPLGQAEHKRDGAWRTFTAGLRYASEDRITGVLLLSVGMMTVFGMPYMTLLPAIADKALGGGKVLVSFLMTANGLGAVIGALVVASLPKTVRREPIVRYTLLAMALLLIAFALSRQVWLSLALSTAAGAAFLMSTSIMNTSVQARVPHALRGRVMSLFVLSFMGLMPVSSLAFGPLGSLIGPTSAVMVGAAVLLAYALFLVLRPSLLEGEERSPATPRD